MTENTRLVHATPDEVWSVLSDGWLYPLWVVGAARMREVDKTWPDVGSKLHHSVGTWPLLLNDETEVLDATVGRSMTLSARAWPAGEAEVHIRLDASGVDTHVRIEEKPVAGPGVLVPRPLRSPALKWRNSETLRRLSYLAERRV